MASANISGGPQNVYGNAVDLQNARNSLNGKGNFNYVDTSAQGYKAGTYGANDIVVGGAGALGGVVDSGSAMRFSGLDRGATATAIQNYANGLNQPVQQPQQQQQAQPDIAGMIRQQSDANKAAQAAQLQKTRDLAISGYNAKIGGLEQTYQPLRNAQDFQGAKNVNATNEQMANMGITNSGDAVTAQIQNRVGNENALNSLNLQQNNDKTALQTAIDNANNGYNSDLASSNAGIDATALQSAIAQANADRTFNAGQTQNTFNNGIATAGLTGNYNGNQTMLGKTTDATVASSIAATTYQNLVNQGYPTELAAKLSESTAKTQGLNLNNIAQGITNGYLPQQLQGGLDVQKANIDQSNASASASYASANKSNASGSTTKPLTVTQQASVDKTEATANATKLTADTQTYLDQWASGKAEGRNGRADQNDMLNYLKSNAGILTSQGVDADKLATWVKNNYTWVR